MIYRSRYDRTKASATKQSLFPGDTSLLRFTYDTRGKHGPQEIFVLITANTDSLVRILQLKAKVR